MTTPDVLPIALPATRERNTDSIECDLTLDEIEGLTLNQAMLRSDGIIRAAVKRWNPVAVVGLYSGGNDSTTMMHLLRPHLTHAAHINTGIGIDETRTFVRDTCAQDLPDVGTGNPTHNRKGPNPMTDNIWDDPSLANGDYVKFVDPGDKIVGKIVALSIHQWDDGKPPCPKLTILEDGESEPRILTAGQAQLKSKLAELRPSVGDRIAIVFRAVEKRDGGRTLKLFDVETGPSAPVVAPAGVPATSLLG